MKLAIISDTHNKLRPEVLELLHTADAILHGGDISKQDIVNQLRSIAPLYVVRGNNDKEWAEAIPHDLTIELGGLRFYMVHKKSEIPKNLGDIDIVIYGHSHKYDQTEKDGILFLNPGSCGPRRFNQEIAMAMMDIENGQYSVKKIVIPHEAVQKS